MSYRDKLRFAAKCILALVPYFILAGYLMFFPMYYMDGEYAMFAQQKDYAKKSTEENRVLVIGDSRAKVGFAPALLSDDTYNLSLGGISAVEGYYTMKRYLKSHPAPEVVFIAFSPRQYATSDLFWQRSIFFNYFSAAETAELLATAASSDDTIYKTDNMFLDALSCRLRLPHVYLPTLYNSYFTQRKPINDKIYESAEGSNGYAAWGMASYCDDLNWETEQHTFAPSEVQDIYLHRLLKLLQGSGIQTIIEQTPMNSDSVEALDKAYVKQYSEYMESLSHEFPDVTVNKEIYSYLPRCFGDESHLNATGSGKFCEYMKKKYPNIW